MQYKFVSGHARECWVQTAVTQAKVSFGVEAPRASQDSYCQLSLCYFFKAGEFTGA